MSAASDAIRMLRERARHAAAATQIFTRWSYLIEAHGYCREAGVPLPEDGRNHLANPLMPVKKAASLAGENANPFIVLVANETLQLLEPEAVQVAVTKREKKREKDARRTAYWNARRAIVEAAGELGLDEFRKAAERAVEELEHNRRYLAVAQRVHEEKVTVEAAGNVVSFPARRGAEVRP